MSAPRPRLVMTVDVEDWPQSSWDRGLPISDYSADNTRRVLDLLAEFPAARATFFVLGKFAQRHPKVVEAIRQAGHEVASHGHGHVEVFHLTPQAFAQDLDQAAEAIAAACGVRPRGYRAPDFSIVGESLWALEVLAEAGYEYDSSIFPIAKARYGIGGWPRQAVRVRLKSGSTLAEMPPATLEALGRRLPVGGGGYARLMPGPVLTWALARAARQLPAPPVFYCHPYELDPDEFQRLDFAVPRDVQRHQGLGRKHTAAKLRRLLRRFQCIAIRDALVGAGEWPEVDYGPFVLKPGDVVRPPIFERTVAVPKQ